MAFQERILFVNSQTNGADFTVNFSPPIMLDGDGWMIGLHQCSLWNSVPNISSSFGNNRLRLSYDGGSTWALDITLDDGIYGFDDINNEMIKVMDNYNVSGDYKFLKGGIKGGEPIITLSPDVDTLKGQFIMTNGETGKQPAVDIFSVSTIYKLFGWNFSGSPLVYNTLGDYTQYFLSQNVADIQNDVEQIYIHCDIASQSIINSNTSGDILYQFMWDVDAGALETVQPHVLSYTPVAYNGMISKARFYLTDQALKPITLLEPSVNYQFSLKRFR